MQPKCRLVHIQAMHQKYTNCMVRPLKHQQIELQRLKITTIKIKKSEIHHDETTGKLRISAIVLVYSCLLYKGTAEAKPVIQTQPSRFLKHANLPHLSQFLLCVSCLLCHHICKLTPPGAQETASHVFHEIPCIVPYSAFS